MRDTIRAYVIIGVLILMALLAFGVNTPAIETSDKPIVEINLDGVIIYESSDGQVLRMWQIPHRMEAWLMGRNNIIIENMYSFDHRKVNAPASIRYYLQYRTK